MPGKRSAPSSSRGGSYKSGGSKRARTDDAGESSRGGRGGSGRGGRGRGGASAGSGRGGGRGGSTGRGGGRGGSSDRGGRGGARPSFSSEPKVYKKDWRTKPKFKSDEEKAEEAAAAKHAADVAKGKKKGPAKPLAVPAPAALPEREPASSFRIMCGSYERHLYGLHCVLAQEGAPSDEQLRLELKPIFMFPAHPSAIASVAAAGGGAKWAASGAGEDVVKVWDLRRKVEVGILQGHTGVITSLSFPTRTYLLSSSSSGELNIYRTRDWALLRTLRGHTGAIRSVAAHPGARLALSIGDDALLRAWDLMRAKAAGSVRLALDKTETPEHVSWSCDGETFVVLARGALLLFDSAMRPLATLRTPRHSPRTRGTCVAFAPAARGAASGLLSVGTEDGKVNVYALPDAKLRKQLIQVQEDGEKEKEQELQGLRLLGILTGHKNRVKSLSTQSFALPGGEDTELAVSISSDGHVRVFDLRAFYAASLASSAELIEAQCSADYDTRGARLTCLTTVGGDGSAPRKGGETESDEEEDPELGSASEDEEDSDLQAFDEEDDEELDEEDQEELEMLKEQIRPARAAGVALAGMSEIESDDEGSDEDADEDEDEIEEA